MDKYKETKAKYDAFKKQREEKAEAKMQKETKQLREEIQLLKLRNQKANLKTNTRTELNQLRLQKQRLQQPKKKKKKKRQVYARQPTQKQEIRGLGRIDIGRNRSIAITQRGAQRIE